MSRAPALPLPPGHSASLTPQARPVSYAPRPSRSPAPRSYTPLPPPRPAEVGGFPSTSELVDKIPLIKSPSFWVPKPTELPPDIHPLPDDVQAYFVYPHTIESHALSVLPAALQTLQHTHSQRLHLLASLAESKERARKARLNQIAPGWAEGGVMEPVRKESVSFGSAVSSSSREGKAKTGDERGQRRQKEANVLEEEDGDEEEEEQEEEVEKSKATSTRAGQDLFGELERVASPAEAGEDTLDQMRRDQMLDFVDGLFKLDGNLSSGKRGDFGALI